MTTREFTLKDLSTKALFAHALPKNESIIANLEGILEVLNRYSNEDFIITSGYRPRTSSTSTSQHPLGLAVDIVFKGTKAKSQLERTLNFANILYANETNIINQLIIEKHTDYVLHIGFDFTSVKQGKKAKAQRMSMVYYDNKHTFKVISKGYFKTQESDYV